jgi:hypothetical protein
MKKRPSTVRGELNSNLLILRMLSNSVLTQARVMVYVSSIERSAGAFGNQALLKDPEATLFDERILKDWTPRGRGGSRLTLG